MSVGGFMLMPVSPSGESRSKSEALTFGWGLFVLLLTTCMDVCIIKIEGGIGVRFQDIPQLTFAHYAVDISLHRLLRAMEEYQKEYGLQLCPDFQRGHVWTEEQQVKYVEFLLRGGQSSRDILFNHTAWNRSFKGEMVCVDGLQRLTACAKFLKNELKVFGHYLDEFEDKPYNVHLRFHINDLPTRKQVLAWYLELNDGGTVHTENELARVRTLLAQEEGEK
jgi:hypothetical protein